MDLGRCLRRQSAWHQDWNWSSSKLRSQWVFVQGCKCMERMEQKKWGMVHSVSENGKTKTPNGPTNGHLNREILGKRRQTIGVVGTDFLSHKAVREIDDQKQTKRGLNYVTLISSWTKVGFYMRQERVYDVWSFIIMCSLILGRWTPSGWITWFYHQKLGTIVPFVGIAYT